MISQETLDKLATFDTPTICNIIEIFEVRPRTEGYMDSTIRATFPEMPPIVGYAAPALIRSAFKPDQAYGGLIEHIDSFESLSGQAIVVFQDMDDKPTAAAFGEMMCTSYQSFGAQGLITDAPGRDILQVKDIGFPIWTNREICSHGYFTIAQVNVTITVAGLVVYPDDLLHADANGVTNIPKDIAAEVADIGDEFVQAEVVQLEIIHAAKNGGTLTTKVLAEARAETANRVAKLRERVSRAK